MDIGPQYSDYLDWFNSRQGSEGNAHPMSQQEFDNLPIDQKWFNVSGGLDLKPGDPRYQAVQGNVPGLDPGRTIGITPGDTLGSDFTNRFVNGANSLYKGNGWYASAANQLTPQAQYMPQWQQGPGPWMLATVLGGAMAGNAGLLGSGGEAGAGANAGLGWGPEGAISPETALSGGAETGSFGGGATPAWASGGATAPGAGVGWGAEGAISPETAGGAGGMGVAQNGIGPGSLGARLTGAINNPSSLLSGSGLLGSAGKWAIEHPLTALGALQTVGGLLGGGGGGQRGDGGGWDGSGAPGNFNINRGPWTPNPYTAMQLANFRFTGG